MQTSIPIFHGNHEAQGDQLSCLRELLQSQSKRQRLLLSYYKTPRFCLLKPLNIKTNLRSQSCLTAMLHFLPQRN